MGEPPALTDREGQVLEMIGRGYTTRRISESLEIEVATVRKHRENLMRKLDLHSTAQIVLHTLLSVKPKRRRMRP